MSGQEFAGTMPVPDRQRFDEAALARYLSAHVAGFSGPLTVEMFRGGQSNPTFLLTAGDGAQYVLRRKPAGQLLPSAHAVDREFRITRALFGHGVPVAEPICLCEDFELASAYAHARSIRLADGPDEVHRNQIGRLELARHS